MKPARRARLGGFLRKALLVWVFGLVIASLTTAGAVKYTARSEFCNSCHIMEPFYRSWQASSHGAVKCVECHYEPGTMETIEGKAQAISQLAKYLTRTEGTKPWAKVSDQSCLRSGCHSVRELDGPLRFGEVRFDHRPHLFDNREGRRLRCTTCHSQVTQEEHIAVQKPVCYLCHFHPRGGADGAEGGGAARCSLCHEPPQQPVLVAGRPFEHQSYLARGVACELCHQPVVEGQGAARRERCRSCHGEPEKLERYAETAFLHEAHVVQSKVECFECHDEIRHGAAAGGASPHDGDWGACQSCHAGGHGEVGSMLAGSGAAGVATQPSRMLETRLDCKACHSGLADGHGGAAAGDLDCIHCHGTGYAGMLATWQEVVGEQLAAQRPLLDTIEAQLPRDTRDALRRIFDEARRNLDLVEGDGSRGAHNVAYAVAALRASAARIDDLYAALLPEQAPRASAGLPLRSSQGCAESCHLGIERREHVPRGGGDFPHRRHLLEAGLDCAACHGTADPHGAAPLPAQQCASCHHAVPEGRAAEEVDCARCHAVQHGMVTGRVAGYEEWLPSLMPKVSCIECHGEPPEVLVPGPQSCVLCHEEGYDELLIDWRTATEELLAKLQAAVAQAEQAGADPAALAAARRALDTVLRDGSRGAHNSDLSEALLSQGLEALGE